MHINPAGAQVLFVDLQAFLTSLSATEEPGIIGKAAGGVARTALALDMPITFSLVRGDTEPPQPVPEVLDFVTGDNVFVRQSASAFTDAAVLAALSGHGRKTIVIAGCSAEVAVLHTGLDAIEAGYKVHVLVDGVGGHSARTEKAALNQLERAGATLISSISLLSALAPDFSKMPGTEVLGEIFALVTARTATPRFRAAACRAESLLVACGIPV